jgi:O-antigen/teichoic acid export membrane protein
MRAHPDPSARPEGEPVADSSRALLDSDAEAADGAQSPGQQQASPTPTDRDAAAKRSILGAGFIYTIAGSAQQVVGFVLLPLFATWLGPDEFGQIGLILSINAFAAFVFPLGLEVVVVRGWFHFGETRRDRTAYGTEIETLLLVVPIALAPVLTGVLWVFGISSSVPLQLILASLFSVAIFTAATLVPYAALRAERNVRSYSALAGTYVVVQIITRVAFVGVLDAGVSGWVAADIVSALILLAVAPRTAGISLRFGRWSTRARSELRRSLPLVPHGFGSWGLAVSDRLILAAFVSLADVGLYSVAYQASCTALIMIFSELNRSVVPEYASLGLKEDRSGGGVRDIVALQVAMIVMLSLAAAFVVPQAIDVFLPDSYRGAGSLVPWLVAGAAFVGLYQIPMNHITYVRGDTKRVWFAAVVAAVFSISLNLLTVPHFGVKAAAVVTAASYLLLLVLVRTYEVVTTKSPLWPQWSMMARYALVMVAALIGLGLTLVLPTGVLRLAIDGVIALAGGLAIVGIFWRAAAHHPAVPSVA